MRGLRLQIPKLVFGQAGRFEGGAKGSRGNVAGVHRDVGLSAISVTQNDVRTRLLFDDEPSALQLGQGSRAL